jgi:hypothetical protein
MEGEMSHQGNQSKAELDFEVWLDEEGFFKSAGEFYECPGGHIWHESDVSELYAEALKKGWASHE